MEHYFRESADTKLAFIKNYSQELELTIQKIVECLKNGNKLLIAGNGGSAADSAHIAAELIGRYKKERASLPAIALTTDTSILTAIGNDYSFEEIFSKQVEWLGKTGDIFLWISTSGNSKNIIRAALQAKKQWVFTIALTGKDGGQMKEIFDSSLIVPSNNTPRIQECHMTIYHTICEEVENRLF